MSTYLLLLQTQSTTFVMHIYMDRRPGSSVNIVTSLRTGRSGFNSRQRQ